MEDRYQKAGDDSFRVTWRSLNAALLAFRNYVHDCGIKAEFILRRKEDLMEAEVYNVRGPGFGGAVSSEKDDVWNEIEGDGDSWK